ncbi:hypothetical protein HPB50_015869 [Hyalomma asiaticum]|uniref:Uncharacterized protein n=1 Tax=Hyalomma asiaticum TaxID=266040 RepID=A0ACB7RWK9_HYAAI|nr:hypothetical protein HPB50_015869 [Hyalomma asiaticum]
MATWSSVIARNGTDIIRKISCSGEIKKRLAENCRRKSDICGSGISRAPLRGSGRHNRRSNSVEAGTTRRKSSRRRSPHDLGSADLATWLRETRPLQARSSALPAAGSRSQQLPLARCFKGSSSVPCMIAEKDHAHAPKHGAKRMARQKPGYLGYGARSPFHGGVKEGT